MSEEVPSLQITLGRRASTVLLSAGPDSASDLRRLAPRFRTVSRRSASSAEIDLDDLLANLVELTTWPTPASVRWEPELARLATEVTLDAQTVQKELANDTPSRLLTGSEISTLLGSAWVGDLTSFQRRDVAKLLALRHGANFSVPGAGKTRVGLAIFQAMRNSHLASRLLIVCPKSAYEAWREENSNCLNPELHLEVFGGKVPPKADALLVNYERIDGAVDALSTWLADAPSMLILDEAHRMKLGAEGTYGAACIALGPRARRRLILTGTPAPNGVKDLESLFGFVWPGHGRQTVARAVADGTLKHASTVLRPLFTRTTKKELGLTPASLTLRRIPLQPLHREVYDALINQLSARAIASPDDFQALGRITMYLLMAATSPALLAVGTTRYEPLSYQVPPLVVPEGVELFDLMRDLPAYEMSPKYQEALAVVAENVRLGRKTLVWSTFVRSLTTLNQILGGFSPAMVHGGTEDRDAQIDRFRNDPDCMVLLSNPATLGEGISLHRACHDALYIDRDFAAGRFLQSLDRIHRLGLDVGVETRVTVLVTENTIDEVVAQRLDAKLKFMGRILDDPAVEQLGDLDEEPAVGGGLDVRDLQSLMGHLHATSP